LAKEGPEDRVKCFVYMPIPVPGGFNGVHALKIGRVDASTKNIHHVE